MIKKLFFLSSLFLILASTSISAQAVGQCGTVSPEWREIITQRLLQNKDMVNRGLVEQRNAITYVPVTFHLFADNDGNGRISEASVLDMLCRMNEDYRDIEIQFYIHNGFNYVDNTNAYAGPGSFAGGLKMRAEKVNGTINIYIMQNADTPGGQGTTLGYYDPLDDWLVLRKQEISYGSGTIPHELGHFFSLLHPHNGWDAVSYNDGTFSNPAPDLSPGGIATERQAQTGNCKNCNTAGDYLCDTPPDYNFGFGWPNCNYNAGTMDPCGDIVDPMETNIMGYFLNCAQEDYVFTPQQVSMMESDLQSRKQQQSINPNFSPSNTQTLDGTAILEIPENNEVLSFNNVYFDWATVEGADTYIFEIDRFISFNVFAEKHFVSDGSSNFELDLQSNTKYYWRVTPYNQYSSCAGESIVSSFTTGSQVSTTEIESVSTWSVSPNPASGDVVRLMLDTNERFTANIRVHNIAGQLIKEIRNQDFVIGNNKIELSIADIQNGTYLVSIQSENGIINNKVVVAK